MYKEVDDNGQFNLDCRLESEKSLEDNILTVVEFASDIQRRERKSATKDRFDGYGHLADDYQHVLKAAKSVKEGMNDLLEALQFDDSAATDRTEGLILALMSLITTAVRMAGDGKLVSLDLFRNGWNTNADENGFEEAAASAT